MWIYCIFSLLLVDVSLGLTIAFTVWRPKGCTGGIMKRILLVLMSVFMLAFLVGCGNDASKTTDSAKPKSHNLADDQIAINFAGSGTLRQQIEQGAPASLFISADEKNMKMLQEKDLVSDVKPFVTNELVLVVPKGQPKVELGQIATVKRIVLGNPETVPAGNYGKQVLTKLGVWEQVEHNVVYAKDVKAVTASISQGAGDAGFIYKTDAIAAGDAVQISAVTPTDSHDPVIYPIGIIKKYDNALAKDFYQYVMSPEGKKVLEKYGFSTSN